MPPRHVPTLVVVLASLVPSVVMAQSNPDGHATVLPASSAPALSGSDERLQPPLVLAERRSPPPTSTSSTWVPQFETAVVTTAPVAPDSSSSAPAVIAMASSWTLRLGAGLGPFPGGTRRQALAEEGFSPVYLGLGAGVTHWLGDPSTRGRAGLGASFSYRFGQSQPKASGPTLHDSAWMALADAPVMLATTERFAFLLIPRVGYGSNSLSVGNDVPSHGAFTYGLDLSLVIGTARAFALTFGYLRGIVPAHGVGGDYDLGGVSFWLTGLLHV